MYLHFDVGSSSFGIFSSAHLNVSPMYFCMWPQLDAHKKVDKKNLQRLQIQVWNGGLFKHRRLGNRIFAWKGRIYLSGWKFRAQVYLKSFCTITSKSVMEQLVKATKWRIYCLGFVRFGIMFNNKFCFLNLFHLSILLLHTDSVPHNGSIIVSELDAQIKTVLDH